MRKLSMGILGEITFYTCNFRVTGVAWGVFILYVGSMFILEKFTR